MSKRGHAWDKGEIVGYHPQVEPQWVTSFGYQRPKMRYTCQACGYVLNGDGGSGLLILRLSLGLTGSDLTECPGVPPDPSPS